MTGGARKGLLATFLGVTVAAFILLLWAFLGFRPFSSVAHYHLLVPGSVNGLERGAPVKIRGVRVGNVAEIELEPRGQAVRVTLEIAREVRIPSDATAYLELQGLTGLKLVDVLGGTDEAPALPPGGYLDYGETALQKLTGRADELAEISVQALASTRRLVQHLEQVAAQFDAQRVNAAVIQLDHLLANLNGASTELHALLREGRVELRRFARTGGATVRGMDRLIRKASDAAEHVDRTSAELQRLVASTQPPLRTTLYNLRQASESLRELGRTLSANPSALIFSRPPPARELP